MITIDGTVVYTTIEAAQYCGLTLATFRYHVRSRAQHIRPDRHIGRGSLFTQETLDRFKRGEYFKPRKSRK